MSMITVQDGLDAARDVLRARCRQLGMPTLRCDTEGRLEPDAEEPATAEDRLRAAWLRSPFLFSLLRREAPGWAELDPPPPVELFEGLWAIPLVETRRRRRIGYVIALALEPAALLAEQFQAACQAARLDARAARDALAPIATFDRAEIARLGLLLAWSQGDRVEVAVGEEAICTFSRQLTEAYEELSLLLKLGQSMNQVANPSRFVTLLASELHATLSFRWIAVRFVTEARDARHMAGRCHVGGEAPLAANRLPQFLDGVLSRLEGLTPQVIRQENAAFSARGGEAAILVHPLVREGRLIGAIFGGEKHGADQEISNVDIKVMDGAAQCLMILLENAALYDDQQSMFIGTLGALTASIDAKDRYTCGHSERVAHLSSRLADAAGLGEHAAERLLVAGLVHDVGKIGVPESVLCKPGRLTEDEFEIIKTHPEIGHRILRDIPQLADVLPAVLHHHERWDGRGYPHGLRAGDIPLFARVISLADSFDAMSSTRTYRAAMPRESVLAEIARCAGAQFDPKLTQRFVALDFSEYDALVRRHVARERQGRAA